MKRNKEIVVNIFNNYADFNPSLQKTVWLHNLLIGRSQTLGTMWPIVGFLREAPILDSQSAASTNTGALPFLDLDQLIAFQ